jgi:hypothetical protein
MKDMPWFSPFCDNDTVSHAAARRRHLYGLNGRKARGPGAR